VSRLQTKETAKRRDRSNVLMNRQARLEGSGQWADYGNVTFFEAIKTHAILTSQRNSLCQAKWVVEVRCESEPEVIDTFEVQTTIHAEILNPRKGM
jgi:hypothetical protein